VLDFLSDRMSDERALKPCAGAFRMRFTASILGWSFDVSLEPTATEAAADDPAEHRRRAQGGRASSPPLSAAISSWDSRADGSPTMTTSDQRP
jgi:hypothetical protein